METILFALWFFLPAGIANTAPIVAAKMPYLVRWDTPIDLNNTYRGKRIFGSHKTWRGIAAGVLAAILTVWLQQQVVDSYQLAFLEDREEYLSSSAIMLGFLFGFGALMGDALKSFRNSVLLCSGLKAWLPCICMRMKMKTPKMST